MIADVTMVGLLPGMGPHMLCEVSALCKLVVADGTCIGSLSSVRPHVYCQCTFGGVAMGTDTASIRLELGVHSQMILQVFLVRKRVTTGSAFERLAAGVLAHVDDKCHFCFEFVVTYGADMNLPPVIRVLTHVLVEHTAGSKLLVA